MKQIPTDKVIAILATVILVLLSLMVAGRPW
jgi:hypothetical protein